jgi:hypothetical protein
MERAAIESWGSKLVPGKKNLAGRARMSTSISIGNIPTGWKLSLSPSSLLHGIKGFDLLCGEVSS